MLTSVLTIIPVPITPYAGIACFTTETITQATFDTESMTQSSFNTETLTQSKFDTETLTGC